MEILAGVPEDEVQRFLSAARRRRFERGEVLFHEGDPADCLHLIASGRVAVRLLAELGESVTLEVLGRDDVVGELALLDPSVPRSATVVALEKTETMAVFAAQFAELRTTHPGIDSVLLALLARRNRLTMSRLVEALYVGAETRVLRRLVAIAASYMSTDAGAVVIPLTQDDLAGLAGTTRETVNRVLRREAEQGSITLARRRISIEDMAALERRSR